MRPPALHWARKRSCCSFSFLTYLLPGPIAYAASSCSLRPPAPAWSSRTNSLATDTSQANSWCGPKLQRHLFFECWKVISTNRRMDVCDNNLFPIRSKITLLLGVCPMMPLNSQRPDGIWQTKAVSSPENCLVLVTYICSLFHLIANEALKGP
ncbi:uncharacterized protein [Elaeis guineensis]|uniref:uncharacterized protein isoform X2 n=1 Tax=Elaeis guineensis var. tenera TaxID=51953 RepID=UPI003C6D1D95